MKTLVISKPVYDFIFPLVEFPSDGDNFFINNSIKTLSNIGCLTAITFAKYGIDVSYTGVIGEDYLGNKIKEVLSEHKIDTSCIETSYQESTSVSYKIYNTKTNTFTSINEIGVKNSLTKYKYEFIPEVIIMDDGDYSANLAALNNYPNALFIYISEKYSKTSSVYCNKCKYVICTLKFASEATGVVNDLNKPKNIINLFQKYIDLYNSNLIIRLDNFDFLYCVDDEVRLIKNVNNNIKNKENLYYSILSYYLSQNIDIENSIKLTNKTLLYSSNELDIIKNIPEYKVIKENLDNYKSILNTNNSNNEITNQNKSIEITEINNQKNAINNNVGTTQPQNSVLNNIETNNINSFQNNIVNNNNATNNNINISPNTNIPNQTINNVNNNTNIEQLDFNNNPNNNINNGVNNV